MLHCYNLYIPSVYIQTSSIRTMCNPFKGTLQYDYASLLHTIRTTKSSEIGHGIEDVKKIVCSDSLCKMYTD